MLTEAVELLRFDQISYFVKGSNKKMYPSIRDALAEIANEKSNQLRQEIQLYKYKCTLTYNEKCTANAAIECRNCLASEERREKREETFY